MKGMTILEMMISLFISTFVLSSVITIYIETQTIIEMQQAISAIIENSNTAFYFLFSDIKKNSNDNNVHPFHSKEMKEDSAAFSVQHTGIHENNAYFIAKTKRKNHKGDPVYALYQLDINKQKKELVEGINDMKIQYTILKNNMVSEVKSNEISHEDKVIGLDITLTFISLNTLTLQKTESMYVSL